MTYSQNTNEIIRELNEFIVRAKETAETARKCKVKEFTAFWGMIADNTDSLANRLKSSLERITAIAESPDEIGNRFAIIKAVEDVAFETNLLAFNVNLMISRCNPEYVEAQKHLGEMYTELAKASAVKASRITSLFNELSALIFEDMKKFAASKIKHLKDKGREVASGIQETPYLYIKNEIMSIADELSEIPCEQVSIKNIEDFAFRLSIISVAADIDVFRMPSDKNLFCGLKELKNEFYETAEALSGFVGRESNTIVECATGKHFDDIAFQGCILLFYTKGETEKMGYLRENGFLSEKQKEAFAAIFDKINKFVTFTRNATEESEYSKIADMLYSINEDLCVQADILAQKGSAVSFLAGEFKKLADCVKRCAK